jgi:non-ribosomal peptide synthetase component E (peptide arylation enzyme)
MYLTQGLHRAVQATPGKIATVHGDRQRTFAEHADRVARFAGALRGLGHSAGSTSPTTGWMTAGSCW